MGYMVNNSIKGKARLALTNLRASVFSRIEFITMLTTVEGIYVDGVIKLAEQPAQVLPGAPVIVTFLPSGGVDLRARGIGAAEAAELRARLSAFAEDWESPEMSPYDDYHAAKSRQ